MLQKEIAEKRFDLAARVRAMLIEGLELPDDPELVDFDTPLFGRGFDLDSLDTIEIVSLLDEEFGVQIDEEQRTAFGSINKLAEQIQEKV